MKLGIWINQDYDKREVDDNSDKSEGMCNDRSKRMDDGSDENNDDGSNENVDDRSNENVNGRSNKNVDGESNKNVDDSFNETDSNEVDSDDDERFKWINNNENEDFYRVGLNDTYEDLCNNKIDVIETLWPSEVYKDLVSNPDLSKNFLFDYKEQWEHDDNGNLVRVYFEQNRRQSEYLIFLTLGNIPNWCQNSPDAKALVGFLPHLITRDNKLKGSTIFRQMQRKLEQHSFEYLLSPLLQKNGIYLAINGRIEHFTPHLSAILADMSEAQNICCTYKSYHTQCPCYKSILSNNATECSIHEYNNFFWKFQTNIYDATAMDHMHLQEIGLFSYMLDYTRNMIAQQCGNQFLTKMDNRLGTITPYNNLRILSKGYQQGVKFTGAEMRDVMKIIVFVLDELYAIDNGISCIKLIKCYIKFIKMYKTSKKEKFNESELKSFEHEIIDWIQGFVKLFKNFSPSNLQLPKFHMWRYYTIHTIKRYESLNGLATDTYETLHKNWVKNPYRITNKKNVLDQMLKTVSFKLV
ncbi:hypothetical protein C1646_770629 [Rhizophagus diaphanus]|nr:hypothetical protein C1646_770629 [Rhizophagus diaphanus] [Rhizophagus sp. MUCL 43196]